MELNRKIGNDICISDLGFGAWAIGGGAYGAVGMSDALGALNCYFEHGGNFIDTAQLYKESESIIGEFLSQSSFKNDAIIATKTAFGEKADTLNKIESSLDESLKKLKRDYVDVFYFHAPPEDDAVIEAGFDIMQRLKDKGKIRAIGASIKGVNVTQNTVDICNKYIATQKIDVIQLVYSIFRQKNEEVFENAKKSGVALVGRTSMESGLLTGKYGKDYKFSATEHRNKWSSNMDIIADNVESIKKKYIGTYDDSMVSLAVRFAMYPEAITNTIVGAKNKEQMEQLIKVSQRAKINEVVYQELREMFCGKTDLFNVK